MMNTTTITTTTKKIIDEDVLISLPVFGIFEKLAVGPTPLDKVGLGLPPTPPQRYF